MAESPRLIKQTPMARHFLLFPLGSSGDVHPFIGLGRTLRARGHRVTLFSCEYFGETAVRSGLEFEQTHSTAEYLELQQDPALWDSRRGTRFVLERTQTVDSYRDIIGRIAALNVPGQTVLVGGTLALGARIARDHLKIPMATVHLQPSVIVSPLRPALQASVNLPRWWPWWLRRLAYRVGEKWLVDPMLAPKINQMRRELGLAPVSNIITRYWHSPDTVVCLFPEGYAAPAADWPANIRLASFPLYDEANIRGLSDEQERVLDAGDPPVVVTFGSAMRHAKAHFAGAAEAIRRTGRRGILLTPHREQIPDPLPEGVSHAEYIPLSRLLPRAALMVHHGGIGTAAQALLAGVPQLVMPMSHDQPDNAVRLENLGLASWLTPKKFTPANIARALDGLLNDPAAKAAARVVSERLKKEDGLGSAATMIEQTVWRDEAPAR